MTPLAAWQGWRVWHGAWADPARWNSLGFCAIGVLMGTARAELLAFLAGSIAGVIALSLARAELLLIMSRTTEDAASAGSMPSIEHGRDCSEMNACLLSSCLRCRHIPGRRGRCYGCRTPYTLVSSDWHRGRDAWDKRMWQRCSVRRTMPHHETRSS